MESIQAAEAAQKATASELGALHAIVEHNALLVGLAEDAMDTGHSLHDLIADIAAHTWAQRLREQVDGHMTRYRRLSPGTTCWQPETRLSASSNSTKKCPDNDHSGTICLVRSIVVRLSELEDCSLRTSENRVWSWETLCSMTTVVLTFRATLGVEFQRPALGSRRSPPGAPVVATSFTVPVVVERRRYSEWPPRCR